MSQNTKTLHARRLSLISEARKIAEAAAEANRPLDAEEERQFTEMNAEADALNTRINAILDGEKRAKDSESKMAELEGRRVEAGAPAPGDGSGVDPEIRAFLNGEKRAIELRATRPVRWPRSVYDVHMRDLSKLTAAAGADTVPTSFYDRLVDHLIETSSILRAGATVLNTAAGEQIQVPKTTAHSTATLIAEAGAISESDPAFGQVPLEAFKYAFLMQASSELLQDTGVDLEGYLAMQAGRALGNGFGAHAITGTGSSQPNGIVTASTLGVTGGTGVTGAFTGDDLIDLFYSVIEPYRMSRACAWMMRDATVGAVRKLKDSQGQYLWQPGLQAGAPDLLLGKPVITDPNVAATGIDDISVIFGDFSQYFVRLAGGVRFERSNDFAFANDLVSFRAILRADGDLIDTTGAVKHFVGGAS